MSSSSSSVGSSSEQWGKLRGLIGSSKFCMLSTRQSDGTIRSRPMATQETDYDTEGEIWFFTQLHSHKVDELKQQPNVNVSYIAQNESLFISVSGTAGIVLDKQKMKDMWNPALKAWFPKELDDPELALLRVNVSESEYWNNTSNTLVTLYGYVKAAVTGQPHTGEMQDHSKIHLQSKH